MTSTRLLHAAIVIVYVVLGGGGMYLLKSATLTRPEHGPVLTMVVQSVLAAVTNARFVLGFVLYAASFTTWLLLLQRMPLSTAFPVAMGTMLFATQLIGVVLLREKLAGAHIAGLVLIMLGVGLVFLATPEKEAKPVVDSPSEHAASE